jgi:hypothetical protein
MFWRLISSVLVVAISALTLTACGGGSSSSTPTPATTSPSPRPTDPAQVRAQRRQAGAAAAFVIAGADNSVPTFGSQAGAAERGAAETSLGRYLGARQRGDWPAACRLLARMTRQGFAKLARSGKAKGCAPVLAALSKESDLADPLIGGLLSLRVRGDNAFALFYGPGHQQYFVPLLREGGTWKPTQPTPLEYPPATTG